MQIFKNLCVSKGIQCYTFNTSPGSLIRNEKYYIRKTLKFASNLYKIIFGSRKVNTFYISPDSGYGLFYTYIYILALCIKPNAKIFLHHRVFSYLCSKNILMTAIVQSCGQKLLNVYLCDCMKSQFHQVYGSLNKSCTVSNLAFCDELLVNQPCTMPSSDFLRIGLLSNLSLEKGLDVFLLIAKDLYVIDPNIRFELAGPFESEKAEEFFNNFLSNNNCNVYYSGPLYDYEKCKWFDSLDIFLFPTKYANEAQPNVLFEALSRSCSVLSVDTGCIKEDILKYSNSVVFTNTNELMRLAPTFIAEASSNILSFRKLNLKAKELFLEHRLGELQKLESLLCRMQY